MFTPRTLIAGSALLALVGVGGIGAAAAPAASAHTPTDAVLGTTALPSGVDYGIAIDPSDHQVFVSGPNGIYQLDGATGKLVDTIPVSGAQALFGLTVNPTTHHVYVDALTGSQTKPQNTLIQLAPAV